jgi:hypothetical protein
VSVRHSGKAMTTIPIAPSYRNAFRTAVVVQLLLTVFLLSILDGGKIAAAGGCAMIGFWLGVLIVVMRRPHSPRVVDLLYIRWGYIPLLVAAVTIAVWLGKARV